MRRLLKKSEKTKRLTEKYPDELKCFAMTLQFYSSKAYEYVRKVFNHALPHQSVIRKWASSVNCSPGFTQLSFNILENTQKMAKERGQEIICNLVLDEMSIKKQIDFTNEKTWGYVDIGTDVEDDSAVCATQVLVLMVVAINAHWKLPVAYFLIHSLTGAERANIIKETLVRLANINIKIVSVICDGPTVNFSMLTSLGCQVKDIYNIKSCFNHPTENYDVFVILDTCHMLKLVRNNWANLKIFKDPYDNTVDFQYLIKLHTYQQKEGLAAANKLKKTHMEWQKQKMKVTNVK